MAQIPVTDILLKAMTSVAQALAMASIGIIFTRIGVLDANSRKVVSVISMKITIPCLLFSSILTCPQGGATQRKDACPELTSVLAISWPMIIFPLVWVAIGVACGFVAAKLSCCPPNLRRTMIAATAFGNSTGLPIVLLTAIAQANVLGLTTGPATQLRDFLLLLSIYQITYPMIQWSVAGYLLKSKPVRPVQPATQQCLMNLASDVVQDPSSVSREPEPQMRSCSTRVKELLEAALVPPVIAVLLATFIGVLPSFRSIFVDTIDFDNDHPVEWLFNAVETFGKAAVPLNMLVLGSSLASIPSFSEVHWPSTLAAAFAKMVLVPSIVSGVILMMHVTGILSSMIPSKAMHHQLMLVACLLSTTPTANNLTIMTEMYSGSAGKAALASTTFVMYCFAPFLLTAWIVVFTLMGEIPVRE